LTTLPNLTLGIELGFGMEQREKSESVCLKAADGNFN